MLDAAGLDAITLTIKLAASTTAILLVLGTPLAWWLARTRSRFKSFAAALVALPLVLPPVVLGFYLLVLLGPAGPLGKFTLFMGWGLLPFTFSGLLLGSVFYSLPFVVQPLQNAFQALGDRPLEAAATLRASPLDTFFSVVLPLCRPAYLSAAVMGFAHTVGEFGIVLMLGGNIPGQTRVLSVQIYDHVEALEYNQAHWLAGGLLVFSFLTLLGLYALEPSRRKAVK
ncbi:Sulfate transport system permease protein CysT [Polaromonas vacuolata]|uniref:Molybdenum transport system permease n=1 Tax=Polaromonas vacuolata TaxID=37448 RepID=A0A6H2H8Z3_9BURK|nr:molybdate ABC transporter permease subunit [Polaromonas vacuolata]QJC56263.1 Sulfate transport system permease protein CysT [Polaromonas vacuolata]